MISNRQINQFATAIAEQHQLIERLEDEKQQAKSLSTERFNLEQRLPADILDLSPEAVKEHLTAESNQSQETSDLQSKQITHLKWLLHQLEAWEEAYVMFQRLQQKAEKLYEQVSDTRLFSQPNLGKQIQDLLQLQQAIDEAESNINQQQAISPFISQGYARDDRIWRSTLMGFQALPPTSGEDLGTYLANLHEDIKREFKNFMRR